MKIPANRRRQLHHTLGIHNIGGGGKYLGLPEQFGRSKVDVLRTVVRKVANQVDGWYTKFLSPAGKEILIKSVAQAQAVYMMNCFLLPKSICAEINSHLSKFRWGSTDNGARKISWLAWQRLSCSKNEGELGFKDLYRFNLALLAKQAWRILQFPSSLLARIYKARYHRTTGFLDSHTGSNSSYGWKSISAGKTLLQCGLRVKIGNGMSTKVQSDHWLPTLPPRAITGTLPNADLRIADLWHPGTRNWDIIKLNTLLTPADADLAKTVRVSRYVDHDSLIWAYTLNGKYTVKSGYWVSTHVPPLDANCEPPPGSIALKKVIWKLPIAPKIRHFIWKMVAGALPTAYRLQSRIPTCDPICQRCCLHNETINHVLFLCPYAQAVWRCGNIRSFDNNQNSLEDNISELLKIKDMDQLPSHRRLLPFWLLWMIWKSRNEFLFQQRTVHPSVDATRAVDAVEEWLSKNSWPTSTTMMAPLRNSHWEPPAEGWIKCNFDSAFKTNCDFMGIGWILRTSTGAFIEAGWTRLSPVTSALQAEASGFLYVLQRIWYKGWRNIWFEGDNLTLTNTINKNEDHLDIGTFLLDDEATSLFPWLCE